MLNWISPRKIEKDENVPPFFARDKNIELRGIAK